MDKFIGNDVLNYVSDFIILINLEGKIIFVNSVFKESISPKVELIGQNIGFFINQLNIEALSKSLHDFPNRLPLIDIEHTYKKDDGLNLHILWSFFPQVNNGNTIERIVAVGKNITELKKLSSEVETLDNIIKYSPDWIYWKNKDLIYLGCNERFAKSAGYSKPEDIIGKSDKELIWHEYAKKYNSDDQDVINTGAPKFGNEDLVPLKDGNQAIVISNKVPLLDSNGNVIGILGISTDITEQKATEKALRQTQATVEELERLDNIIKYAPDWIYWKDKNLIYLGCNDRLAIAAGYPNRYDLVGKTDFELPWCEYAMKYRTDDKEVIESGKPKLNIEETVPVKGGKKSTTITNKVPLKNLNGEVIGVLGIATDITNRKKTEQELIKAKATEKANALKTSFIQNMQHDIRTPTSSMWAVLEELTKNHQLPDHELLILLRDSAKQLYRICSEVIDFDRMESGVIPILSKKIAIRELVSRVIELNQIAAYDKKLNLYWSVDEKVPEVVKGDEHRVSRILINLIGNALKFTSEGSVCLYIHLIQERKKDYIIQFELQDTGIGIPVEKQTNLYEKFNRLSPSNSGLYPGSGLGLHLVKKYVEELNGEISVDSEPNRGTIFYIDIPFEKALVGVIHKKTPSNNLVSCAKTGQKQAATEITSTIFPDGSIDKNKYKVLFIEDNPAAMKVGTLFLHSLNYDVTEAADVKNALQALNVNKFDFVVSDIGLPDGTGIDVIKEIKKEANALNFSTPFFALTANADHETISEAEKAGFMQVMIKPMQKELIKSLVHQYITKTENPLLPPTNYSQEIVGLDLPTKEEELFKLEHFLLLDVEEGLALLGDETILREILNELIDDLPKTKADIEQAHDDENWLLVEKLAHKAKGGAAYVGATRMKYACQYLERYKKAGYSALLEELYWQLLEVLNETQLHVSNWLTKTN